MRVQLSPSPPRLFLTATSILPRPRLNNQIRVPQVRLIDETGTSVGIVDIKTALEMAYEKKLDLVEISPKAVPPVARIIDFGKFQYQQEKQLRKQKTKHKAAGLKLIKISLGIAENDAMIKIKKLVEFLESGHKVKVDMFLRGRERANKDFAEEKFKKFLLMIAVPYKTEQSLKKLPTGFNVVLSR